MEIQLFLWHVDWISWKGLYTFYDLYFIGHKKIFVYILYLVATDQNYFEGVTALDKFKFLVCDKNNCTQGILNLISLEYCMLSYHDSLQHAVSLVKSLKDSSSFITNNLMSHKLLVSAGSSICFTLCVLV